MRFLSMDVGSKRIGIALTDVQGRIATPYTVITRKTINKDLERIKNIINDTKSEKVIVGLPLNLSGNFTQQTQYVLAFIEKLRTILTIPIEVFDESMTTMQAEETLIEANVSRKKRKGVIDKLAATIILNEYLNHNKTLTKE